MGPRDVNWHSRLGKASFQYPPIRVLRLRPQPAGHATTQPLLPLGFTASVALNTMHWCSRAPITRGHAPRKGSAPRHVVALPKAFHNAGWKHRHPHFDVLPSWYILALNFFSQFFFHWRVLCNVNVYLIVSRRRRTQRLFSTSFSPRHSLCLTPLQISLVQVLRPRF